MIPERSTCLLFRSVWQDIVWLPQSARQEYRPLGVVHLFMAVPVGLAMLIGQQLNTFGDIQTYEHISTDGVGVYRAAARLQPSA